MECESILECRFSRSRVVHHIHLNITPSGGISTFFITYLKLFTNKCKCRSEAWQKCKSPAIAIWSSIWNDFFFAIIEEEQGPTSSNYINVPFLGLFRCPNLRHFRAIKTYIQRCPHVLCQIKFEEFENIILTGLHTLYRYDFCFNHFFRLAIIRLFLQGASITQ